MEQDPPIFAWLLQIILGRSPVREHRNAALLFGKLKEENGSAKMLGEAIVVNQTIR
ncbi:hypothetical protein ACI7RC_04575 [Brevibacillus sp. B_LB10_24]|uniref:hypothetical protein n=1 Tax=Brevibacillus sp. B_LB10_24 TaxID=3380645 RepID=UPI0038BE124D